VGIFTVKAGVSDAIILVCQLGRKLTLKPRARLSPVRSYAYGGRVFNVYGKPGVDVMINNVTAVVLSIPYDV
jgi:hypothetical protein